MAKKKQSINDLRRHLDEQINNIKRSANAYDQGHVEEAKRIATAIRILVHKSRSNEPLLKQLDMMNIQFVDTSVERVNTAVRTSWE